MRLLVTRPQPQADEWVASLRAAGFDAQALPLIGIAGPADPAPVRQAWATLGRQQLVVFVSPNAAQRFFEHAPPQADWPGGVWAGSPGPGTSAALLAAGVPSAALVEPAADAPQFDSEALWQQLQPLRDWRGARVLIVRGDGGREWLADTLRRHGAQVLVLQAYRRVAPVLSPAQAELLAHAQRQPSEVLWLFSSSEAIDHLRQLAPAADWAGATAWVTHPRIAAAARAAGFVCVRELRPGLPALWEALSSQGMGPSIQSPAP